jgi:hypothetical protein
MTIKYINIFQSNALFLTQIEIFGSKMNHLATLLVINNLMAEIAVAHHLADF